MTSSLDLSGAMWIKSTHSDGNGGNCIEWAPVFAPLGVISVRDSKDPQGPALVFSAEAFAAFVAGVKNGERRLTARTPETPPPSSFGRGVSSAPLL
ncbi:DUF397 domain-containing protein [Kitasatospora sp. HPMI-4]|uniref:DUF397 domain-containing protein n=1 Tax=Kitasatospora sp. HPMI-4 TaxID=3448443 RepID=UPI003F1CBA73